MSGEAAVFGDALHQRLRLAPVAAQVLALGDDQRVLARLEHRRRAARLVRRRRRPTGTGRQIGAGQQVVHDRAADQLAAVDDGRYVTFAPIRLLLFVIVTCAAIAVLFRMARPPALVNASRLRLLLVSGRCRPFRQSERVRVRVWAPRLVVTGRRRLRWLDVI